MKWLITLFENIKGIIQAPIWNILGLGGIILIFFSFITIESGKIVFQKEPTVSKLIIGSILIVISITIFLLNRSKNFHHIYLDYVKGIKIERENLTIFIKTGEIQELPNLTKNSTIVLPANTAFVDDCITDPQSTLGAFFLKHFPDEIPNLPTIIKKALDDAGVLANSVKQYPPGSTIILPDRFSKPAKIIITASTIRSERSGITSNPHFICHCIERIFERTINERTQAIYMPILGSGHGGVDRGLALLYIILAVLHYSKFYHHIKQVNIVVHPNDIESLNKSKELQQIIAL